MTIRGNSRKHKRRKTQRILKLVPDSIEAVFSPFVYSLHRQFEIQIESWVMGILDDKEATRLTVGVERRHGTEREWLIPGDGGSLYIEPRQTSFH